MLLNKYSMRVFDRSHPFFTWITTKSKITETGKTTNRMHSFSMHRTRFKILLESCVRVKTNAFFLYDITLISRLTKNIAVYATPVFFFFFLAFSLTVSDPGTEFEIYHYKTYLNLLCSCIFLPAYLSHRFSPSYLHLFPDCKPINR